MIRVKPASLNSVVSPCEWRPSADHVVAPGRYPILRVKLGRWHTDEAWVKSSDHLGLVPNGDLPSLELFAGRSLDWSPMPAPDSRLLGDPYLESCLDVFQGLHLVIQFESELRMDPRNVELCGHKKPVHLDCRLVVAGERTTLPDAYASSEK